jgi:hypothetical protein
MEQTTTPASPEVDPAGGFSTEQAAEALLTRWQSKHEAPVDADAGEPEDASEDDEEPDTEPEQSDEDDADGEEEATEAPAQEPEYELEFGGSKYTVKPSELGERVTELQSKLKELEGGATRKFQEAAAVRKQAEEMSALASQHADLYADFRAVNREIERIQGMDLQSLSDSDPVSAQKEIARMMQLQQAQQRLGAQLQQANAQMTHARQQSVVQEVESVKQYARTRINGWSEQLDKALGEYVQKVQVRDASLSSLVTDPALYEMAVKAFKYDTLQAAKPAEKRAVQAPKTLKPQAATAQTNSAKARADDLVKRVRSTGSTADLANLFLARAGKRK